jgi:superfamily I DNA/RNA helicase
MTTTVIDPDLSTAQRAAVMADGNVFVDAGPGTGKTHVIVARIRRLVAEGIAPQRILVVTFSRRAVAELRSRIAREGIACEVRTFHGFASRLLEADGPRFKSRRLLDAFTETLLLDTAIERSSFATLTQAARMSERFRDDFSRFVTDLRRADAACVRRLRGAATPRLRDLFGAFDRLTALHDELRASDLDDLIARAVDALEDETSPASRWLDGRYTHVLIDEFQDIDATQLELVARLKANLFAVGDASQAIYAFRGALSGVIGRARERFAMRRVVLDESRRCPQIVCDLASKTPFLGTMQLMSAREVNGSVTVCVARTSLDEAALIADRVEDALGDGVPPEGIAVLVRSMRPLGAAVEAELRARNIAVAGGGPSAFLGDQNVETLRLGLRLLECPTEPDRWVAFLGVAPLGFDVLRVRAALQGRSLATLGDGIDAVAQAGLAGNANASDLANTLRRASEAFVVNDIGRAARRLINGLGLAARAAQDGGADANVRAAVGRLGRVVEALSGAQRHLAKLGEAMSSAEVLDALEERIEALASEETPADGLPGVRLLTIHGAKGLEFDFVVIGDAVEGRFPATARRSTLLDEASLDAARKADVDLVDARDDASLVEEAALWYVAVTRSRNALLVTYTTHGADGAPRRPSRFIPAAYHPADDVVPFERRFERYEDIARESGDPEVIAALRAALSDSPVLAALLEEGPGAFAALPEYPVKFTKRPSVSAAKTWLECPRRFYYGYILRLKADPKLPAVVGSALHDILAKFHEKYREFTTVSDADVPAWSAYLLSLRESAWADLAMDSVAKRNAYGRFADRALAAYARLLLKEATEHPFTVAACERPIESVYRSGALRGSLDRIDIAMDGTLTLRDYKSGRMHDPFWKTLAKATSQGGPVPGAVDTHFNPQLALYRRGAEAAFNVSVRRLEFVFLNGVKSDDEIPIGRDALSIDQTIEAQLTQVDEVIERHFVAAYGSGVQGPIATAKDEKTCMFCAYKAICPGPVPS